MSDRLPRLPNGSIINTTEGFALINFMRLWDALCTRVEGAVTGSPGQIPGTSTSNNASAGNVGEYDSVDILIGAAVALTSGIPADIASFNLPAGDWWVYGTVATNPAAGTTTVRVDGWISTASATLPTTINSGAYASIYLPNYPSAPHTMPVGSRRLSLASATTVYLSMQVAFGVSTMGGYGFIAARRAR